MTEIADRRQAAKWSDPVELDGDYVGWWVRFDTNTPMGIIEDLETARTPADLFGILAAVCGESNYVDRAGAPIDLTVPDEWKKVGRELLAATITAFKATFARPLATRTPTSSRPTSADSDRESPLVTA